MSEALARSEREKQAEKDARDSKLIKGAKEVQDFTQDSDILLGGVAMKAKQFMGIGTLNVETGRGEVKARPGDFIISFFGAYEVTKAVVSEDVFETLWKNLGGTLVEATPPPTEPPPPEESPLETMLSRKILNDKSGPDKFMPPRDLISEHPERQVKLDEPTEHPEHPIVDDPSRPVRPGHELPPHPAHLPADAGARPKK